ncbi:Metabotropic GABA-B receptor subtype 3A [Allomyces arbusculus]|nr:Metabotropic GABA-B receptor subtype 3A [Allomyces arbusculus]
MRAAHAEGGSEGASVRRRQRRGRTDATAARTAIVLLATVTALLLPAAIAPWIQTRVEAAQFTIGVVMPTNHPAVGGISTQINNVIQAAAVQAASLDTANSYTFLPVDSGFTQARGVAAMYQAMGNGSVAIIGELSSQISLAIALAANRYKLWQCSGASTSSALSDKGNFPYFFRTIQDDPQQGVAMAYFLQSMGWKSVNTLSSSDSYGQSISSSFMTAATALGIDVVSNQVFSLTATDYTFQLKAIAESGSNIIVYVGVPDNAVAVLRQAGTMGLLTSHYAWVGPDALGLYFGSVTLNTAQTAADNALVNGFLYVYPRQNGQNAQYAALQAQYRTAVGGSAVVDSVPYGIAYADCVRAMVLGIKRLVGVYGAAAVQTGTHSATLADFLAPFSGASGDVTFDNAGNRQGVFDVMNIWNGTTSTVYSIQTNHSVLPVAAPKFLSGTSTVPADRPQQTILYPQWTDAGVQVLAALRILSIIWFLASLTYTFVRRHQPVVKNLSFPFLASITVGCALVLVSEFLVVDVPTRFSCHGAAWIFTMGYELVLASAAVKTFRVYKIFDNKALAKLKNISNRALFSKIAAVMAVQVLVFAIWVGVAPRWPELVSTKLYLSYACKQDNDTAYLVVLAVSLAYNIGILLTVCFFAYKTRNVMSSFRETSFILYTAQNIFLTGILALLLTLIPFTDFALGAYYVRAVLVLFATVFAHGALVGRVAIALWQQPASASLNQFPESNSASKSVLQSVVHSPLGGNPATPGTAVGGSTAFSAIKGSTGALTATTATPVDTATIVTTGQFPVKQTSKWLAHWVRHTIHLFPNEGILALVPDGTDARGTVGAVLRLTVTQFDPEPPGAAGIPAVELFCHGSSWLVQMEHRDMHSAWVAKLAAVAKASASSMGRNSASGRKGTGGGGGRLRPPSRTGTVAVSGSLVASPSSVMAAAGLPSPGSPAKTESSALMGGK